MVRNANTPARTTHLAGDPPAASPKAKITLEVVTPAPKRSKAKTTHTNIARRSDLIGSETGLDLNTFGGRLSHARLRAGVTQDQLADALSRSRAAITAYEVGRYQPDLEHIERIAQILKVAPSFLAFGSVGTGHNGSMDPANIDMMANVVNIEEMAVIDGTCQVVGIMALTKEHAKRLVSDADMLQTFVMDHNAEAFNLRTGDRVICNKSVKAFSNRHDLYVVVVHGEMEVVGLAASFGGNTLTVRGPRGETSEITPDKLEILGAVVSTITNK